MSFMQAKQLTNSRKVNDELTNLNISNAVCRQVQLRQVVEIPQRTNVFDPIARHVQHCQRALHGLRQEHDH